MSGQLRIDFERDGESARRGWRQTPLGMVVDILDSRRVPVNAKEREGRDGDVPYYGATGQVGWIDDYLFDEELVLVGEDGAPFLDPTRPVAYRIHGKAWVNNHAHVLRGGPAISNGFLLHQLNVVDYSPFVSGTTRLKLSQGPMREIPLWIAPLAEQHRIVAEIEKQFTRLDDAVATLEKVQVKLRAARASVLKAAVEGRLVPTEAQLARAEGRSYEPADVLLERILAERKAKAGKGKYKPPVEPDTEGLPELPEGWVWSSLDQAQCHLTSGSRDWKPFYGRGTSVFLLAQNVRPMGLDLSTTQLVDPPANDPARARSEVMEGDLLVTIVGANTGQVCRVPRPLAAHFVCQSVALIRPALVELSPFFELFLNSPVAESQWHELIYGQGRPHLGFNDLRVTAVALPPLEEQQRIVAEVERRLSVLDALGQTVETNLRRLTRLRQSILKRAFEGKLVPQDPNDEPATELLARIRGNE